MCACSHKISSLFDSIFLFFLCGGDTAAVLPMHPTLYVCLSVCPYLFPLVFAVSVVIPTSSCFFMSLTPSPSLTHDAYVNRTMTYDHTTSSWRSTNSSLPTSITDIILFYFFAFAFSTTMRYLSYRTYRCRFPPGGLGVCKGKAGDRCTYIFRRSYQINQRSESSNEKKSG